MVMDTSLHLTYRGNTIDTTTQAKIKVALVESENYHTLASPPLFVNKRGRVYDNRLFVNSNLQAKNEHISSFNEGAVVDVYDLTDGKYHFSFYVYHYRNTKRMMDFRISGHRMVVLYDKLIRVFDLVPTYFPEHN